MKKDKWLPLKITGVVAALLALIFIIYNQFIIDEDYCYDDEDDDEDDFDFDEDLD